MIKLFIFPFYSWVTLGILLFVFVPLVPLISEKLAAYIFEIIGSLISYFI